MPHAVNYSQAKNGLESAVAGCLPQSVGYSTQYFLLLLASLAGEDGRCYVSYMEGRRVKSNVCQTLNLYSITTT